MMEPDPISLKGSAVSTRRSQGVCGFSVCLCCPSGWGSIQFRSVQLLSRVRLYDPMNCSTPGLPVHHQLPDFTQTHVHQVGDAIQPSHPLLSPSPPAPNPSQHQGLFSNESTLCMRWPKYWSFSFSISPSNEPPGLISFKLDWLDLHAVQGTLKSLLQYHSPKASILRHSAFFIVQLSHPCITTGKTIALTRRTFVGKVMSLLFNMLARLVITFLPRSKVFFFFNFMAAITICSDFGTVLDTSISAAASKQPPQCI